MKKIGPVEKISRRGEILVRGKKPHKIGFQVVNKEIKRIGKIIDVIGPVSRPFIVVHPKTAEVKAQIGQVVYSVPHDPKKRSKRGRSYHRSKKK